MPSDKKISPDKKFHAESNGALLNVVSRENETERFSLALNKYNLRKPEIFRWSANSKAVGIFITLGVPSDAGGFTSSRTNYFSASGIRFKTNFSRFIFPNKKNLKKTSIRLIQSKF